MKILVTATAGFSLMFNCNCLMLNQQKRYIINAKLNIKNLQFQHLSPINKSEITI